jgi:hypothetical protein
MKYNHLMLLLKKMRLMLFDFYDFYEINEPSERFHCSKGFQGTIKKVCHERYGKNAVIIKAVRVYGIINLFLYFQH